MILSPGTGPIVLGTCAVIYTTICGADRLNIIFLRGCIPFRSIEINPSRSVAMAWRDEAWVHAPHLRRYHNNRWNCQFNYHRCVRLHPFRLLETNPSRSVEINPTLLSFDEWVCQGAPRSTMVVVASSWKGGIDAFTWLLIVRVCNKQCRKAVSNGRQSGSITVLRKWNRTTLTWVAMGRNGSSLMKP